MGTASNSPKRGMIVHGAAFLGIGSIGRYGNLRFAREAGSAVWLSFLIAGVVALLQGYAVAKLGARYPLSGGRITFLLKGFGGISPVAGEESVGLNPAVCLS